MRCGRYCQYCLSVLTYQYIHRYVSTNIDLELFITILKPVLNEPTAPAVTLSDPCV